MFDIGQKVVCIDGKFPVGIRQLYDQLPVESDTYVIRDIRLGVQLDCKTGDASVLLIGIMNPKANSKSALERGFSASRFVPLTTIQDALQTVKRARKEDKKTDLVEA